LGSDRLTFIYIPKKRAKKKVALKMAKIQDPQMV